MKIEHDVALTQYSTMAVGGSARLFTTISTPHELVEALEYAHKNNLKFAVIGEGSNSLFSDQGFDGLIIKNEIMRVEFTEEGEDIYLHIGAGENWDEIVKLSVDRGLTGIEALSYIPGSAGAAPVQNIGAYGQELSETLVEVEVIDANTLKSKKYSNDECDFSYRNSRFKTHRNEIVTGLTIKLKQGVMQGEFYESLSAYFTERNIVEHNPKAIRQALEHIRWSKLPKPSQIPNCGSYFHNVIVDRETLAQLQTEFSDLKYYVFKDKYKIPTGWLLEKLGLKGFCHSHGFCCYDKQALVIINPDRKSYADLLQFENMIRKMVWDHFGLELTREPILID